MKLPRLRPLSLPGFAAIAAVVAIVDQITKYAATHSLKDGEPVVIVPGFFQLIYRTNTGAAWSMFQEHPEILTGLASLIAIFLTLWSVFLKSEEHFLRWPLGAVLGGAIGNLIDRFRIGHVVDFFDAYAVWGGMEHHFPTFNVADSGICVGMTIMIAMTLLIAPTPTEDGAAADDTSRERDGVPLPASTPKANQSPRS